MTSAATTTRQQSAGASIERDGLNASVGRDVPAGPGSPAGPGNPGASATPDANDRKLDELAQIIRAYNDVTEKLQSSHERLKDEVARLRGELASADAQLQRSKRLAALGEMAAGIAHEIRNPLAAIQLYATMIEQDLSPAEAGTSPTSQPIGEAKANAGKIAQAVRGLNGIVNDVLTFSRELKPRIALLDVATLFDRVVASHLPALEEAGIRVECLVAGQDNLTIDADEDLLHQAVLNLVRNAVEAMSRHEGVRQLTLDARDEGDAVVMIVRDTGPGIDEAAVDRIFNPFFTTRSAGTGLGLAIVHRIIDAHAGAVVVHNDGGAVFELSLPKALAAAGYAMDAIEGAAA